jgi:hypothetical protein
MNKKDNIIKYTACGEKKTEIVQHVSKHAVGILVDYIYKVWQLGASSMGTV